MNLVFVPQGPTEKLSRSTSTTGYNPTDPSIALHSPAQHSITLCHSMYPQQPCNNTNRERSLPTARQPEELFVLWAEQLSLKLAAQNACLGAAVAKYPSLCQPSQRSTETFQGSVSQTVWETTKAGPQERAGLATFEAVP
eukprot:CAMPEP_0174308776 /NCGR_PEP_ID=MMETSP0810-20121108/1968_1 /TAXON_ID=73025 ORGANISM="Eutreptiella gymnastica-like, Strain CCMP1594" /NCGR_SAMPLE_ID=MMETSP0810 /ASSEMBLY_ACC=CAM_ASM_000659 /LENGTH=139 /DNA_ID=CAMNT_0015416187 /DNA_START=823 /DNA_END=1246 /DNA_ORIENTATION=-